MCAWQSYSYHRLPSAIERIDFLARPERVGSSVNSYLLRRTIAALLELAPGAAFAALVLATVASRDVAVLFVIAWPMWLVAGVGWLFAGRPAAAAAIFAGHLLTLIVVYVAMLNTTSRFSDGQYPLYGALAVAALLPFVSAATVVRVTPVGRDRRH